jgi:excisionase family DNA binding protein
MALPDCDLDPTLVKALSQFGLAFKALVVEAFREAGIAPGGLVAFGHKKLLTVKAAAAAMSLSDREVRNMIANGELGDIRQGRKVLVDADDINALIRRRKVDRSR